MGNWLAAPFTLLGVTFQNWMLLALATVLVWIVLVRLTPMTRDRFYYLLSFTW